MTGEAAARFTVENAKVRTFSDFLTDFSQNPVTGYLAMIENEGAVKQAVKNLLLTERTERPYRNYIGSKINNLLFEPLDPHTEDTLKDAIKETITNCEPRVRLISVDVIGNQDVNGYFVAITFSIINIPQQSFTVEMLLRRVR